MTEGSMFLQPNPGLESNAEFSPCRKYRYVLWRIWDLNKPPVMFIGLNPSTANEIENDPTIRRVQSFGVNMGFGGVYMMNCFPLISTDPSALNAFKNTPFHEFEAKYNDSMLQAIGKQCGDVIFAWGSFEIVKLSGRDQELIKMFPNAKALMINKDGSPRHPLYIPGYTKPVIYKSKNI